MIGGHAMQRTALQSWPMQSATAHITCICSQPARDMTVGQSQHGGQQLEAGASTQSSSVLHASCGASVEPRPAVGSVGAGSPGVGVLGEGVLGVGALGVGVLGAAAGGGALGVAVAGGVTVVLGGAEGVAASEPQPVAVSSVIETNHEIGERDMRAWCRARKTRATRGPRRSARPRDARAAIRGSRARRGRRVRARR